jgi:hypothetical protein
MSDATDELRKRAFELSPHEQFRLAFFIAENVGYVLAKEDSVNEMTDALTKCEYCGNGQCENCMNTGYKYPDRAELALAAIELVKLPSDIYWVLAKGRLRPAEPLWAVRITDQSGETITEAEGDHPADTVRLAAAKLSAVSQADRSKEI